MGVCYQWGLLRLVSTNKVMKNLPSHLASGGPIGLKIGKRCRFLPEITNPKMSAL